MQRIGYHLSGIAQTLFEASASFSSSSSCSGPEQLLSLAVWLIEWCDTAGSTTVLVHCEWTTGDLRLTTEEELEILSTTLGKSSRHNREYRFETPRGRYISEHHYRKCLADLTLLSKDRYNHRE
jgi:hypothetical protein